MTAMMPVVPQIRIAKIAVSWICWPQSTHSGPRPRETMASRGAEASAAWTLALGSHAAPTKPRSRADSAVLPPPTTSAVIKGRGSHPLRMTAQASRTHCEALPSFAKLRLVPMQPKSSGCASHHQSEPTPCSTSRAKAGPGPAERRRGLPVRQRTEEVTPSVRAPRAPAPS